MKIPESLTPLLEQGLIQEVVRPLRSGKEAQIYLVISGGEERVAKVYKDANHRSFKHRSDYTEGRKVRNTRDQRAMSRQSKYGKNRDEEAWRSAEADIIYRLRDADVRVPEPYAFVENVLLMELVRDDKGQPAPRLADIHPTPAEAQVIFEQLLADTVKMLCAGIVHGDLGEYNVLMGAYGPIIIDFPQALDPASNRNARRILLRDVENLDRFLARHTRRRSHSRYGAEMWALYEKQSLAPGAHLTGKVPKSKPKKVDDGMSILEEMEALDRAAKERRLALGLPPPRPARVPATEIVEVTEPQTPQRTRRRRRKPPAHAQPVQHGAPKKSPSHPPKSNAGEQQKDPPKNKRRRRRRRPADS